MDSILDKQLEWTTAIQIMGGDVRKESRPTLQILTIVSIAVVELRVNRIVWCAYMGSSAGQVLFSSSLGQ